VDVVFATLFHQKMHEIGATGRKGRTGAGFCSSFRLARLMQ